MLVSLMWLMLQCRAVSPQAEAEGKMSLGDVARVVRLPSPGGHRKDKALQAWIMPWAFGPAALLPQEEKNVLGRSHIQSLSFPLPFISIYYKLPKTRQHPETNFFKVH